MYSFSSRVRYSETNKQGILSLVSLVNYLQDCALFQTDTLGVGLDHLSQKNIAWFIAAWQIQIQKMPRYGQDIVVSTWPTQLKGVIAHRNFTICSPEGFEYIRADSLWFMFDFAKQSLFCLQKRSGLPIGHRCMNHWTCQKRLVRCA